MFDQNTTDGPRLTMAQLTNLQLHTRKNVKYIQCRTLNFDSGSFPGLAYVVSFSSVMLDNNSEPQVLVRRANSQGSTAHCAAEPGCVVS